MNEASEVKPQPPPQSNDVSDPAEKTLRETFAAHRASRQKPFPKELREAIFAALESGMSLTQIRTLTGVTARQVAAWKKSTHTPAVVPTEIFSVVKSRRVQRLGETLRVPPPQLTRAQPTEPLVLSFGQWRVSVTQTQGE
jgi:hypothetical protein